MSFWNWSSKVLITTWRRSVSIFQDSSSCPMRSCWKSSLKPKIPPGKQLKHKVIICIHSHNFYYTRLSLVHWLNQLQCNKNVNTKHHFNQKTQNRYSASGRSRSKNRKQLKRTVAFERLIFSQLQPLLKLQSGFSRSHILTDNQPLSHFTRGVWLIMNVVPDKRCSSL